VSNELEPGCLAVIIESVFGQSIGQIVQCIRIKGNHSEHGTIWTVRAQHELVSEFGGKGHVMDSPAKWLKKINPDDKEDNTNEKRDYEISF
jgi:hypothetical protein